MNNLVFDRTLEDVVNRTEKGFYNHNDMQRVDKYTKELSDKMNTRGYVVNVNTKDTYVLGYIPRKLGDFERIRQNIVSIRKLLDKYKTTPTTPATLENLDYIKVNNIEKILFDLLRQINGIIESDIFCGTITCGAEFEL